MSNTNIIGILFFFILFINSHNLIGQVLDVGESWICKYASMPSSRHVVIAHSTSNKSQNPCPPLEAVNDYRSKKVKDVKSLSQIAVCFDSQIPKGYKLYEKTRNGNCISLGVNHKNIYILRVIDADGDKSFSNEDCDDYNPNVHPKADENPHNGIDDNCNGMIDEVDRDKDGFFVFKSCTFDCPEQDCDDTNANINPNAREIAYNGKDDDCNPLTLDNDFDRDGFNHPIDCDDNNANINPNRREIEYNGIDDDCNPATLDDDLDQDGYGRAKDCNDRNPNIHPGRVEILTNNVDDNCNGMVNEKDEDGDKFFTYTACPSGNCPPKDCDDNNDRVFPGAPEIVNNGEDENCSGSDKRVYWEISTSGTNAWGRVNKRIHLVENRRHLLAGDFNGDGRTDVMTANGKFWLFFLGGRDNLMTQRIESPIKAEQLKVGDFDGDGKDDLFLANANYWKINYGGTSHWKTIRSLDRFLDPKSLYIGDYDGDGKSDVAYITSNRVMYSPEGTQKFIVSHGTTFDQFGFLIGDFNGDGKDDIFNGNGNAWRVLLAGEGNWRQLRPHSVTTDKLKVGYFDEANADGKNRADIFLAHGGKWSVFYSGKGGANTLKTTTETDNLVFGDFTKNGQTDVLRIKVIGN